MNTKGVSDATIILLIIAVVLFGPTLLQGLPQSQGSLAEGDVSTSSTHLTVNVEGQSTTPPPATPPAQRADLRLIAGPYLAATNVEMTCLAGFGTWTYREDYVGCKGVGTLDCTTAIAQAAATQCVGTGAVWVCDPNNVYCKY